MFDTLLYAKRLEASGWTRSQAEAQVNLMTEMIVDGVATKQDLKVLETSTQKEFAQARLELHVKFDELRAELRTEMLGMERGLTLRMGAMFALSTTITISVLAFIK